MYNSFFAKSQVVSKFQDFIQKGDDVNIQKLMDFYFHPYVFLFKQNSFGFGFWEVLLICWYRVIKNFVFNNPKDWRNLDFLELFIIYRDHVLNGLSCDFAELKKYLKQNHIQTNDWDVMIINSVNSFVFLFEQTHTEDKKHFVSQGLSKALFKADLLWALEILENTQFNQYFSEEDYYRIFSKGISKYFLQLAVDKENLQFPLFKAIIKNIAVFNYLKTYHQAILIFLVRDFIQECKNDKPEQGLVHFENSREINFIKQLILPFIRNSIFFEATDLNYLQQLIGESSSIHANNDVVPQETNIENQEMISKNNFFQNTRNMDTFFEQQPLSWAEKLVSIFS